MPSPTLAIFPSARITTDQLPSLLYSIIRQELSERDNLAKCRWLNGEKTDIWCMDDDGTIRWADATNEPTMRLDPICRAAISFARATNTDLGSSLYLAYDKLCSTAIRFERHAHWERAETHGPSHSIQSMLQDHDVFVPCELGISPFPISAESWRMLE